MSDQTAQEPTMEEILASIRRIISEDEAPAAEAPKAEEYVPPPAPVAAAPEPAPEPEAVFELEPEPAPLAQVEEEDVLELTEVVETVGDIDVYTPTTAPAAAEPEAYAPPMEGLVSAVAASAAASAFGQLSAKVALGDGGLTIEQMVREILRPLLKDWLDANLAPIVQATVETEVQRISRGQVR